MSTTRFEAVVDGEGRLVPTHPDRTKRYGQGTTVWISLHDKPFSIRSLPSNKFLWRIYGIIGAETGNDPDTVHFALKREAVRVGILEPQYVLMGDQLFEGEPTTVVEQEQFTKYLDWLIEGCETGSLCGMKIHIEGAE